MSENEEKRRTLLVERYKYGVRVYDPFNSHYSYYIKESDERPGWCEILVQEDGKTLDMIEQECVLKNRDHDELMPLLQEVLEYIIRNYDKLKIASIAFADKLYDP